MVARSGAGPRVTDDSLTRFLQTVPGTLTQAQAERLIAQLQPASGESLDEVLSRLASAVRALQAPPREERRPEQRPDPQAQAQGERADRPAGEQREQAPTEAEIVDALVRAIQGFQGWDDIPNNRTLTVLAGQAAWPTVPLNTEIGAVAYTKAVQRDGSVIRAAAFVRLVVTRRTGRSVTYRIAGASRLVGENRVTAPGPARGTVSTAQIVGGNP
jgi:ribosomal protein L12E/L44/L45/RPP1/RPP2